MTAKTRPEAAQAFLDAVKRGFEAASPNAETRACLTRVFDRLQDVAPAAGAVPARVATSDLLDDALQPARKAGGVMAELAARLQQLDPLLCWRMRGEAQRKLSGPGSIANAMIVGPNGLEDRKDVWVGLSLVPPGVRYPEHRHSPEEIYLFLTDGRFMHGEPDWFTPGIGGSLYNEPNILHSMESPATSPLLAIWCLFDERHQ